MSLDGTEKPILRGVDSYPVELDDGGVGIVLHDPLQIAENPIVVTTGALLILEKLDGEHTLRDVQSEIFKGTGYLPPLDQITALVAKLDEECYLEGDTFQERYAKVREEFLAVPTRPSILAGTAVPDDPSELRRLLDDLYAGDSGPGAPGSRPEDAHIEAIVAPHIDLHRGGHAFAQAYKALAEGSDAEVFVVLGVAHFGNGHPFMVTDKDFETPLGTMPAEKDMVARLKELAPADAFGDEFTHKREHSVEFQALFLRHLFPKRTDVSIVPILCGAMYESLMTGLTPMEDEEVSGFVEALAQVINESGKRVCIIAGVDLAHVGPRFGDTEPVNADVLAGVKAADSVLIEAVAERDADGLFRHVQKDRNARNICGYPALYTMLNVLDQLGTDAKGRLLGYEQSTESETQSVVTFCSMAFP